jgi:competence protein ComEA
MKNRKKIIGSIFLIIIFIVVAIVSFIFTGSKKVPDKDIFIDTNIASNSNSSDKITTNSTNITVEIKGEVNSPNVYILKYGSRIKDLISLAGGVLQDSDTSNINLARKLKDEDYIFIPKKGDTSVTNQSKVKNASDKIDINSASKEELDSLSGIGPVTAEKIVSYREKNGPYSSVDDLKKIGGIGDKTLSKFIDKIEAR